MKKISFILMALLMFAFMVPVKAMPLLSVKKTEQTFQKQCDVQSVVVLVNVQPVAILPFSRQVRVQIPFYNSHGSPDIGCATKGNYPIVNLQYLKRNSPNKFTVHYLPDKLC